MESERVVFLVALRRVLTARFEEQGALDSGEKNQERAILTGVERGMQGRTGIWAFQQPKR